MTGFALTFMFQCGISTVVIVHCLIDIAKAIRDLKEKP